MYDAVCMMWTNRIHHTCRIFTLFHGSSNSAQSNGWHISFRLPKCMTYEVGVHRQSSLGAVFMSNRLFDLSRPRDVVNYIRNEMPEVNIELIVTHHQKADHLTANNVSVHFFWFRQSRVEILVSTQLFIFPTFPHVEQLFSFPLSLSFYMRMMRAKRASL